MSGQSLKDKAARGLFWSGLSNGIQQLLNLVFGIVLARYLLTPADYGMVGMLTVFTAIASTLQEGGFIAALTNRKQTVHADYNAVFWFSTSCGAVLYLILFFAAPFIARFYGQPELVPLGRLSFLGFLIASTNIAPRAYLFKQLRTREMAIISLASLLASGATGILLAYKGFAYWGLVLQSIMFISVVTVLCFYFSRWRPTLPVSFAPVREMLGFSSKLIVTNLFNVFNNNLFSVLLGKFYSEREVGYFNQANKWNLMGYTTVNGMVTNVAQPLFASIADDRSRQLAVFRKMLRFTAFVSFPAMLGLSFTAHELIILAVTDKWLPSAHMMQILCVGGAFLPLTQLFSSLVISRGRSAVYMWNTICLSLVQLLTACTLYPFGLEVMLQVFTGINISWLFVWLHFVHREIGLTLRALLADVMPYLLLTAVLIILTDCITAGIDSPFCRLSAKVGLVGGGYAFILWRSGSVIFRETVSFLLAKLHRS